MHGVPVESDRPSLVLIRDPVATDYSRYRVQRDRWRDLDELSMDWLQAELLHYSSFYDQALTVLEHQERGLLLRYEELVAGPEALQKVADFLRIRPKLEPSFVWRVTRFENFVQPGARTFYRCGSNSAWTTDERWVTALCRFKICHLSDSDIVWPPLTSVRPLRID